MTGAVKVSTIQKIANAKGLQFDYSETDKCYVMMDKNTKEVLMHYADATIMLITNDKTWREECNKLKTQAHR